VVISALVRVPLTKWLNRSLFSENQGEEWSIGRISEMELEAIEIEGLPRAPSL